MIIEKRNKKRYVQKTNKVFQAFPTLSKLSEESETFVFEFIKSILAEKEVNLTTEERIIFKLCEKKLGL